MFSKGLLCLLGLIGTISCTPKVGEAPPKVQERKLESLQCLSNLKPVLNDFGSGNATDQKVAAMWDCAENAVKSFKRYVYGRAEDHFEPDEIAKFIEDTFVDPGSPRISRELQRQFMQFKRLFIGGSDQSLTRAELDTMVETLDQLKGLSLKLNPSMKILVQSWDPETPLLKTSEQIELFEKANANLQSVSEQLAGMIASHHQSYELDNFPTFVRELGIFLQQDFKLPAMIDRYMNVIKKVKISVAGGVEDQVGPTEWRNFILTGSKGYAQYLRYYYFIEKPRQKRSTENSINDRTDYLFRTIQDFMVSLLEIIQEKPVSSQCASKGQKIPFAGTPCITQKELKDALMALVHANTGFKFSEKLVDELMKVKVVYFGGSVNSFTPTDFKVGSEKLARVRTGVDKMLPYFDIYTMKWAPAKGHTEADQARLDAAIQALHSAALDISSSLQGSYDLNSLEALLKELDRLNRISDENFDLVKYLPLLKDIKNAVFSDSDTLLTDSEWKPFFGLAAQSFGSYLQYHYFLSEQHYGTNAFLESFKILSDRVSTLIAGILQTNKAHVLNSVQVTRIVNRLVDLDIIPKGISQNSMKLLMDVTLERILWPAEERFKGNLGKGFSSLTLESLRTELEIWIATERYFYQLGPRHLSHGEIKNEIAKKLKEKDLYIFLRAGLEGAALVLDGDVPQVLDAQDRLIISRQSTKTYDINSLAKLNLHRAIGRFLIRSAIDSKERLKNNQGITLAEAEKLFERIRPALEDIGLVDKKATSFIESRFRESNVFTAHSNGDTLSNFQELTDMVGMIFSGAKINSMFRKDLQKSCGVRLRAGTDPAIDEACAYGVYYNNTIDNMASMPVYVDVFKTTSRDEWNVFFGYIVSATGYQGNDQHTILMSFLNLAPHVSQYMEMMYAKFDVDQNNLIDTAEALRAFPSFEGLLIELTKDEKLIRRSDLPALFTYILYYGKPPGGLSDYFLKWRPWKNHPENWKVSASRMQVAQIFSFIAEKTRAKTRDVIPAEEVKVIKQDPRFDRVPEDDIYYGR